MADLPERKLAAIMFTDMVGYSALMQRSEALGMQLLEDHRRMLRPILARYGGQEIKTIGDAFLIEFSSAVQAVQCAVEIQRVLAQHNFTAPPEKQVQVRIGLHVGDVIYQENDVLGDGVNIASRIQPLAEPGGIALSGDVARQIQNKTDLRVEKVGLRQLKNIQEPVEIYRIVLPWDKGQLPTPAPVVARPSGKRIIPIVVAGIGITIVLAGLGWWGLRSRPAAPQPAPVTGPIQSLAVLPLENLMGDPQQEYFVDGMTEALIAELGQISALRVISRTSVMQYKHKPKALAEIARELNVDAVIEGSVLRAGDRVRITAQLIDAKTDRHLWAHNYERDLRDVLSLQSEVARAIAQEIKVKLTPQEQARLASARPISPQAHEAYLRGLFILGKGTEEFRTDTERSVDYLRQAIAIQPDYAEAYAALAEAYIWRGQPSIGALPPNEALSKAKAAATKAVELDDRLAAAHSSLAHAIELHDWDWLAAEQEYRRALELNPSLESAHIWYSDYLGAMGRYEESIAESKHVREINPLELVGEGQIATTTYYTARRFDDAIDQFRKLLELDPNRFVAWFGLTYYARGQYDKAAPLLEKAVNLSNRQDFPVASLAMVYAAAGKKAKALKLLQELKARAKSKYVSPYLFAYVYIGLGQKDEAIASLERGYAEHDQWMKYIKFDPPLDPLRSDPRFQDLVRRMNFPP